MSITSIALAVLSVCLAVKVEEAESVDRSGVRDDEVYIVSKAIESLYNYAKENQMLKTQNLKLMQQVGLLSAQGQTLIQQASSLSQQLDAASSLHRAYDDKTKLLVDELVKQHQYGMQCHQHVVMLEDVLLESEQLLREVEQFKKLILKLRELSLENAAMTTKLQSNKLEIKSLNDNIINAKTLVANVTARAKMCEVGLGAREEKEDRLKRELLMKSAQMKSLEAASQKSLGMVEKLKKQILLSDVEECKKALEQAESTFNLTKDALSESQLSEAKTKADLDVVRGRLKAVEMSAGEAEKGKDVLLTQANERISSMARNLESESEKVSDLKMEANEKAGNQCLPIEQKLERCEEAKTQYKFKLKLSRAETKLLKQTVDASQARETLS